MSFPTPDLRQTLRFDEASLTGAKLLLHPPARSSARTLAPLNALKAIAARKNIAASDTIPYFGSKFRKCQAHATVARPAPTRPGPKPRPQMLKTSARRTRGLGYTYPRKTQTYPERNSHTCYDQP